MSLEFFIGIILPATLGLGVDSASSRNECQEYLLRGKDSRYVGLTTLPRSYAVCLEPQPPGTLRVRNRPVQGLLNLYFIGSIVLRICKTRRNINHFH